LWQHLYEHDPERAQTVHPYDSYRIKRALELSHRGHKPSAHVPHYNPASAYWFFYVTRNRNDLYARINQRVGHMIDAGWIDEVKSLIGTEWQAFVQAKKFIGYPELMQYILHQYP